MEIEYWLLHHISDICNVTVAEKDGFSRMEFYEGDE
jgi:hypothetical protein